MTTKKLTTCLLLLFALFGSATARKTQVRVNEPGTLATLIGEKAKDKITSLKVSGSLNSSDLRFLREMAGCDAKEQPTSGKLTRVDMSDVTFASGGMPYSYREKEQYTSGEHTVPRFLFRKCKQLTEVVLPKRTDKLDVGALEYTSIRRLVIPEGCSIESYAINSCEELEEIVFPQYLAAIQPYAILMNAKLHSLSMHNVGYIAGNAIGRLPSVKKIEIKGYLGHMDGWYTIAHCENLEQIDFRGPVLSTGGATVFASCPKLEKVIFHSCVLRTHFGKPDNCPSFKGYVAQGIVFESSQKEWIAETASPRDNMQLYNQAINDLWKLYEQTKGKTNVCRGNSFIIDLFYDQAAYFVKENKPVEALDFLEVSVDLGSLAYQDLKRNKSWNPVRDKARFQEILAKARETGDYLYVLKKCGAYKKETTEKPAFTYDAPNDTLLMRIRTYFNLDSIAGNGDEISRIKNVMYWLHDEIRHDGSSPWPKCPLNAIAMYEEAKKKNRGYNCRMLATMLNDCYLALGYPSRFLTCQPKAFRTDVDCHVINMVWSKDLGKWVWMDPSFAAYVTDENGLLLHPGEVRQRLINDQPLVLNEDANWNHKQKQTKEHYLEHYMAKNLYWMQTHLRSCSESESNDARNSSSIYLCPEGFEGYGEKNRTNDEAYFWQAPAR